jgi:hypothetical protein
METDPKKQRQHFYRDYAKMWPVGWEALEQWGDDVARIGAG